MHNTTQTAIIALNHATSQTAALKELADNLVNEDEKEKALRMARKSAKHAKRLHGFLLKYAPK